MTRTPRKLFFRRAQRIDLPFAGCDLRLDLFQLFHELQAPGILFKQRLQADFLPRTLDGAPFAQGIAQVLFDAPQRLPGLFAALLGQGILGGRDHELPALLQRHQKGLAVLFEGVQRDLFHGNDHRVSILSTM